MSNQTNFDTPPLNEIRMRKILFNWSDCSHYLITRKYRYKKAAKHGPSRRGIDAAPNKWLRHLFVTITLTLTLTLTKNNSYK